MTGTRLRLVVTGAALLTALAGCGAVGTTNVADPPASCGPQQQQAGEYTVTFETAACPAKAELNSPATIAVRGPQDRPVLDATIVAHCDMPAMKMPTGTASATPDGDRYRVNLALGMAGVWDIRVEVTPPGGQPVTTTFTITAK
jgi:hypothetical protein